MQRRVTYLWRPLWASIAAGRNVKTKGRPGFAPRCRGSMQRYSVHYSPPPPRRGLFMIKGIPQRLLCNTSARRPIALGCRGCADYITPLTLPANIPEAAGDSGFLLENTPTAGNPLDIVTRSGPSISTPVLLIAFATRCMGGGWGWSELMCDFFFFFLFWALLVENSRHCSV